MGKQVLEDGLKPFSSSIESDIPGRVLRRLDLSDELHVRDGLITLLPEL